VTLCRQGMQSLTDPQRVALTHVALLAEECAHPRFAAQQALGTAVLTVNAGYE
jgi:hypothetical protein